MGEQIYQQLSYLTEETPEAVIAHCDQQATISADVTEGTEDAPDSHCV